MYILLWFRIMYTRYIIYIISYTVNIIIRRVVIVTPYTLPYGIVGRTRRENGSPESLKTYKNSLAPAPTVSQSNAKDAKPAHSS